MKMYIGGMGSFREELFPESTNTNIQCINRILIQRIFLVTFTGCCLKIMHGRGVTDISLF